MLDLMYFLKFNLKINDKIFKLSRLDSDRKKIILIILNLIFYNFNLNLKCKYLIKFGIIYNFSESIINLIAIFKNGN